MVLITLKAEYNLIDIWRSQHENLRRYTWHTKNRLKRSRLDFFLISENLAQYVDKTDIISGYKSDHSLVEMYLDLSKSEFTRGNGYWKMNNSFLYEKEYVEKVNKIIDETLLEYTSETLNLDLMSRSFNISDKLLLDVTLMKIRGFTISYAKSKT